MRLKLQRVSQPEGAVSAHSENELQEECYQLEN